MGSCTDWVCPACNQKICAEHGHSALDCLSIVQKQRDDALLQVDAYRKMETDVAKEMGCSMSNWGENSDWCGVHERNPMECQSLEILSLNRKVDVSQKQFAALLGAAMKKMCHEKNCSGKCEGAEFGKWAIRELVPSRFMENRKCEECGSELPRIDCPRCGNGAIGSSR